MNQIYMEARDAVFQELYNIAKDDPDVILLSVDTGAFLLKEFQKNLPNQFYNVGIAEQNSMSVAAGLALSGKKVFVFGIANFVTLRCFEQLKLDICCMDLPVTVIAMGSGFMYSKDGPTHHMTDIITLTRTLPGMTVWSPSDFNCIAGVTQKAYKSNSPNFIYMDRGPFEPLYSQEENYDKGYCQVQDGSSVTIVSTGIMTSQAIQVSKELLSENIECKIIDVYRIKPISSESFYNSLFNSKKIITLEENVTSGGLGSLVCEVLAQKGSSIPVKMLGITDEYRTEIGDREILRSYCGLDQNSIMKTIKKLCTD